MRQLDVYNNDVKAGRVMELAPGKGYVFKYDADYLATDNPPISVTLPKREAPYESEYLFPFFTNLLQIINQLLSFCLIHLPSPP